MLDTILKEYMDISGKKYILKAICKYYFRLGFRTTCLTRRIVNTKCIVLKMFRIKNLELKYGLKIGINARIGNGFNIHHPNGIVIGDNAIIGNDCEIFQQVTIGQKNNCYPHIGNKVIMYSGCKIIGGITIGDNVIVAPNTVVVKDVPNNAIVSGIPAKIIGWRQN